MDAIIFGGGEERDLVKGVPLSLFTVSCNLSYLNANVYFALDDQIINQFCITIFHFKLILILILSLELFPITIKQQPLIRRACI